MLGSSATDTLFGIIGTMAGITIALAIVIVRLLGQVAKINEWIRIYERKNGKNDNG